MNNRFDPVTFKAYELSLAFGFLFPREVFAMQSLVWSLPENGTIVNIGAGAGTSALAMHEARPDVTIYTVDISEGGPFGGFENERNAFDGAGYTKYPTPLLGDSKKIGMEFLDGPIDMLFIDGDHSEAGCRGDIQAWIGHVKAGGIVVLHDYERDFWPDVKRVVDEELGKDYPQILCVDTLIAFRV